MQRVEAKFAWNPPSLMSRALLRKAPWYHGDAQEVGIVRGRRDFIDMGEGKRVHEPTHVVQLAFGVPPDSRMTLGFEVFDRVAVAPICCMASTKDVSSH